MTSALFRCIGLCEKRKRKSRVGLAKIVFVCTLIDFDSKHCTENFSTKCFSPKPQPHFIYCLILTDFETGQRWHHKLLSAVLNSRTKERVKNQFLGQLWTTKISLENVINTPTALTLTWVRNLRPKVSNIVQ